MSKAHEQAAVARRLSDNPDFVEICDEIRADAVSLFSNANSDIVAIGKAHEKIRAVQLFFDAMTARIGAANIEDRKQQKAQHRDND